MSEILPCADLLQQHQRDLNCLSDENRQTRLRALKKLAALPEGGHPPPTLLSLWEHALRTPVLKLFSDPVEKVRELAITITTDLLRVFPPAGTIDTAPFLVPVVVSRVAGATIEEGAEELRLLLLQLVELLLERARGAIGPSLPELVQLLSTSLNDSFPDAKKVSCTLTIQLARALPDLIVPHCASLSAALQPCLVHQHSRVRSIATEALVALLLREPSALPELASQLALITTDRAPSVREQAGSHRVTPPPHPQCKAT